MIVLFFGGLRHLETSTLLIEKFNSQPEGVFITHSRSKQRSDNKETKFLIPRSESSNALNYAEVVEKYLSIIKQVKL